MEKIKKVKLLKTQKHPKGDILKGSIYTFNPVSKFYEYKKNGIVISTINEAGVNTFTNLFKRI